MTQLYNELCETEKWQIGVYGATEAQVLATLQSYRARKRDREIVLDIINHAWVAANQDDNDEARQSLNRAKLAINEFYGGNRNVDFFDTPAGHAFSVLSDAQELLEFDDTRRAQGCMDYASKLVLEQEGVL